MPSGLKKFNLAAGSPYGSDGSGGGAWDHLNRPTIWDRYAASQQRRSRSGGSGGNLDSIMDIGKMIKKLFGTDPNLSGLDTTVNADGSSGIFGGGSGGPSLIGSEGGAFDWFGGESIATTVNTDGSSGIFGSGSSGSGGGAAVAGYVALAILGQMSATSANDRTIDGHQTGDFFTYRDGNWQPHVGTEPWLAFLHDEFGWGPTAGEEFDAAVWGDGDTGDIAKTFPGMADYWADPIRSWLGFNTWKNIGNDLFDDEGWGEALGFISDPIGGVMNMIKEWF